MTGGAALSNPGGLTPITSSSSWRRGRASARRPHRPSGSPWRPGRRLRLATCSRWRAMSPSSGRLAHRSVNEGGGHCAPLAWSSSAFSRSMRVLIVTVSPAQLPLRSSLARPGGAGLGGGARRIFSLVQELLLDCWAATGRVAERRAAARRQVRSIRAPRGVGPAPDATNVALVRTRRGNPVSGTRAAEHIGGAVSARLKEASARLRMLQLGLRGRPGAWRGVRASRYFFGSGGAQTALRFSSFKRVRSTGSSRRPRRNDASFSSVAGAASGATHEMKWIFRHP